MKKPGKIAKQLMKSLFKRPATINYPAHRSDMGRGFRGKLRFDPKLCIGCKMCMRDCPSGAIKISQAADKKFEAEINLGKCIYCGQCVDSCPKKALQITGEFELAKLDPNKLKVVFSDESKDDTAK
ncbi:MAG: 4Fe-4S binding protein [Candidatus Omnitrophica bacterium]|nr:4Fe-4S binding protein [Candidatus Omnitrophota bacterium]